MHIPITFCVVSLVPFFFPLFFPLEKSLFFKVAEGHFFGGLFFLRLEDPSPSKIQMRGFLGDQKEPIQVIPS